MRTFLQFLCEGRKFIGNIEGFIGNSVKDKKDPNFTELPASEMDSRPCIQKLKDIVYSGKNASELHLWKRNEDDEVQSIRTFVRKGKTHVKILTFIVTVPSSRMLREEVSRVKDGILAVGSELKKTLFSRDINELPSSEQPEYFFASSLEYSEINHDSGKRGRKVTFNNMVRMFPQTTMLGTTDLEFGYFSLARSSEYLFSDMNEMEMNLLCLIRINFRAESISGNEASKIQNVNKFLNVAGLASVVKTNDVSKENIQKIKENLQNALDSGEISQNDLDIHGKIIDMIGEAKPDADLNFDIKSALTGLNMKSVVMNEGVKGYFSVIAEYLIPFLLLKNIRKLNDVEIIENLPRDDYVSKIVFPKSSSNRLTDYEIVTAHTKFGSSYAISAKSNEGYDPSALPYLCSKNAIRASKSGKLDPLFSRVCRSTENKTSRFAQAEAICAELLGEDKVDFSIKDSIEKTVSDAVSLLNSKEAAEFRRLLYVVITKVSNPGIPFIQIQLDSQFDVKLVGKAGYKELKGEEIELIPGYFPHDEYSLIKFRLLA